MRIDKHYVLANRCLVALARPVAELSSEQVAWHQTQTTFTTASNTLTVELLLARFEAHRVLRASVY